MVHQMLLLLHLLFSVVDFFRAQDMMVADGVVSGAHSTAIFNFSKRVIDGRKRDYKFRLLLTTVFRFGLIFERSDGRDEL